MYALLSRARPYRTAALILFDSVAWVVGFFVMVGLDRLTRAKAVDDLGRAVLAGALCAVAYVAIGLIVWLHQGRAVLGSFEDAVLVSTVVGMVAVVEVVINFSFGQFFRTAVAMTGPLAALGLMLWGRGIYRIAKDQHERTRGVSPASAPVVVIGAGEGARQLLASMIRDPRSTWHPVGLVDDDPLKRHRRLAGVPVLGRTSELADVAHQTGATTIVMAIPSADAGLMRQFSTLATEAGLTLKVVPGPGDLRDSAKVGISDIRDIDVTDLLGRHQIDTDLASIAGYLTGKRVLVTGAGGSIGSELSRQIATYDPAELIMLDRDESALHAVQLSIYGKAMLDSDDVVLADIRDTEFINQLFLARRPDVVFHAAALKHLPMLEQYPGESIKTNVWGSLTVLEAARAAGVERFVNISTDKAANPCSVLGYSKRLAEGLTAAVAKEASGTYLSVRFGNVLGSRGSVLTAFTAQIANGGPVTVTDAGVTRYFMTIREAVQLVIQAAAIGRDGEALVLDMGDPISIDGVARQLIEFSGQDIAIEYTGLRAGEKMHEELLGDGEIDDRPRHRLISHTAVPDYDALDARALDPWSKREGVIFAMERACADMQTWRSVERRP